MPVFALRSRCQAKHIFRFHLLQHLLKGKGGQVVALIDNDLTVFSDEVFHSLFVVTALDDGNVYASTRIVFAAANLSYRLGREVEEHR